ncbi:hypothetical protein B0T17DRAFT_144896 [Bombardia bombarda]|uniref:Apple domain-containing protein n=1 Tax=Bombardia bombarda TaxID=252184 RepID=A0AA40C8K7_9PEZI|nr:hypothetical protein B0T17DRAFT_144896 [Bombardia bombarda]
MRSQERSVPAALGAGGLILMGIAVGVGVGVGLSNQNRSTAPAASPSVTSPTSSLPSATPTPTASGTTTVANALCPDSSNTHFTTSNGKNFLHICGIDYSGPNEAEDIFKVGTATFDECMEMCANNDECTGAGWGLSGSPSKVCYMKSNLSTPHVAVSSWNFAVLLVT